MKRDVEVKLLLGCTEAEVNAICRFHNGSEHMATILVRREAE
jgi:inorganic pyrophosphatase